MSRDIKKPIVVKSMDSDIKKRGIGYCPTCDKDIHGIGKINYCPNCGQALDWSTYTRV